MHFDKLLTAKYRFLILLIGMASHSLPAIGQPIPTNVEPKRLPTLPDYIPPPSKPSSIKSPKIQSSPAAPSEFPETDVMVRKIKILGSTVFSESELQQAVIAYIGKSAKIQDLLAIRSVITDLYTSNGYLTSGAFLPVQSQDFNNGIVTVQIIEGELERIDINGLERLQERYVRSRIEQAGKVPVNIRNLEEGLQLLQLDPLFVSVNAELKAGTTVGRSILQVELKENNPWTSSLTFDNSKSPSVGALAINGSLSYRNLTGVGDKLDVELEGSEGTRKYGINYTLPLNPQDELQLRYNYNTSRIIEKPFSLIGINNRSQIFTVGYQHFLFRHPNSELLFGLSLEQRESRDFLLDDIPFSFSVGADSGRTVVNVLRFKQEWVGRTTNQVLAARSQFNLGLGILGATINDTGIDGRFLSWQGQFQWVQALEKDAISIIRLGAQLTSNSLLPIEQFGIGGIDTVRGYRQNAYVGDSGVVGTAELRLPLFRSEEIGLVQVAPFIDVGAVWSSTISNNFSGIIASTGFGLRWEFSQNLRARLEWAAQLTSLNASASVAQPQSIIFSLQFTGF